MNGSGGAGVERPSAIFEKIYFYYFFSFCFKNISRYLDGEWPSMDRRHGQQFSK
jgi:hypothetical protein